ncbi:serine/threonine-protein kinase [Ramlibacter albus]|uniref:Serine/threonine protein kinase n=1 Tax=Ramlibacter albus TaxID=2079448 RepID=A0A923MEC5_9BURK|nr:serine/threonine-protein kinase [Ramlibacter albus]MBC5767938.1 serine/threonine protein kinase [Ramlibacter albus]
MDPTETGAVIAHRYRVRCLLGAGGMADVVAADDLETGETVAVKLLREPLEGTAMDRRVMQELLAAARVSHPNLVPIADFGIAVESRRLFIVMELLVGEDLAGVLHRRGRVEPGWILPLFCEALDGLDEVHRSGIVHKDIKPANLFLDRKSPERPRLRVTDFGIARHTQRASITQTGAFACTPRYAAPEYIVDGEATPASDVYQMALVLAESLFGWAMVAGGPVFDVMNAHLRGQLRLPPGLFTSPIGKVLARALSRDPVHRFSSAREFAAVLRGIDPEAAAAAIELHGAMYRRDLVSMPMPLEGSVVAF